MSAEKQATTVPGDLVGKSVIKGGTPWWKSETFTNIAGSITGISLAATLIGVLFAVTSWLIDQKEAVASSASVGALISVKYLGSNGFMDGRQTQVESGRGSFLVAGTFQGIKDVPLVVEVRKRGDRMLCVTGDHDSCRTLLE